ncbi:hypothetical protein E2C01_029468 [Portunus trituberculatus]|uniref:Protein kinase domain-containing protein n=1 Tax=Portunus trituberculatus TaxID=210409 RepID=A0A5B7EUN9_PORTR|nr:hypothetical protein [Portunus trituberculatus]
MVHVGCVAVAGVLTLLLACWFLVSCLRRRCNKEPHFRYFRDSETSEDDDEAFLRSRVTFLSRQSLLALGEGVLLGPGGFSSVRKVVYNGTEMVVKTMLDVRSVKPLLREGRMLVEVEGAGGVPKLLAVCLHPPTLVQVYCGDTYMEYVQHCSVGGFLDSLVAIARLLGEIHAKDICHNDVRMQNITFTGSVRVPVFHLIDLGLTCRFGQVGGELAWGDKGRCNLDWSVPSRRHSHEDCGLCNENEDDSATDKTEWQLLTCLAPEVVFLNPCFSSADVYGFGALVGQVMQQHRSSRILLPLWRMVKMCMALNQKRRCLLTCATRNITKLKERLSPDQLELPLLGPPHSTVE